MYNHVAQGRRAAAAVCRYGGRGMALWLRAQARAHDRHYLTFISTRREHLRARCALGALSWAAISYKKHALAGSGWGGGGAVGFGGRAFLVR